MQEVSPMRLCIHLLFLHKLINTKVSQVNKYQLACL